MHFIEIEKQIKGIQTLKRLSNPDTRTSKVLEEVIRRGISLEELKDLSKVDPELVRKMMEESILGSFFDNKIIGELVKPLFPLRNNDKVTNFAITMLERRPGDIVKKYGEGADGSRAFIVDFKNSIVNYVFQNYMSNFTDAQGNIVNVPEQYNEMAVKPKKGIKLGAEVIDNVIYVDEEAISRDYNLRLYSAENTSPNNYREKGLRPFRTAENLFPTESSYFKYVIEREYQRSMVPFETVGENKDFKNLKKVLANSISDPKVLDEQAYAAFLNQRALIFAFNREALMKTVNYSYADKIMALINEFSYLKDKYPILNQLTKPSIRTGEKVISLNDSRMLKDAQLAEIYYENLKDLGDPTVKKVEDAADNLRISEMFGILPLVSIYQNGIGYSRFGFNEALPYDSFISVMDTASQLFLEKQLNNKTLSLIYSKIMDKDNKLFKNFVVSPKEFNSPIEVPLPPQIATETPTEEDMVDVPPTNLEEPETTINIYAGIGENAELSNFAERPVRLGNETFRTPEGGFQAMKIWFTNSVLLGNPASEKNIKIFEKLKTASGAEAKKLGQQIEDLSQGTWDRDSSGVMKNILTLSFEQNPKAKDQLLATGDATLTHTQDKTKWGTEFPRLLMEVRDELRATEPTTQPSTIVEVEPNYYTSELLQANQDKIYVFGDNNQRQGKRGQAAIRDEVNAMGISTKLRPSADEDAFMTDNDFEANKNVIDSDIAKIKATGKTIVFPKDGLGTGLAALKTKAPKTYQYLKDRLLEEFNFDNDLGIITQKTITTQPNQNSPEGLPPIDRTPDACSS
jgi:predicted NAD-dependent protein-ADP-ribosyltransferase YbiA (DUF1768 family)